MHQPTRRFFAVFGGILLVLSLVLTYSSHAAHAASKAPSKTPHIANIPVGNNYTNATPSIFNYGGKLYVLWTGEDRHLYITQSSDGVHFPNPTKLTDTTIFAYGPQMTGFGGHLYLAWVSANGDGFIYLGWYNGSATLQAHTRFAANVCSGLGMATYNGSLYIAYEDCNSSNHYIDIASGDGQSFSTEQDLNDATLAAPALLAFNNYIYIAWMGSDYSVYLGSYPGYGTKITPLHVQTTDSTISDMGMAPFGGYANLAWHGYSNDNLYTGYYTGSVYQTGQYPLTNSGSLNIPSATGPGMCSSFGHLYVAWSDPSNHQLDLAQINQVY